MTDPPPLELAFAVAGEARTFRLDAAAGEGPVTVGRSLDNRLVLADRSVSRRHAELVAEDGVWVVRDLGSTNGTAIDGHPVPEGLVHAGQRLRIGGIEIEVRPAAEAPPAPAAAAADEELLNATVIRRLEDLPPELLVAPAGGRDGGPAGGPAGRRLATAGAPEAFGHLTRLAGALLRTDSVDQVLRRVTEVAFEALPVERGFVFLQPAGGGEAVCALARDGDEVAAPARGPVPVRRATLRKVMEEKLAVVVPEPASGEDDTDLPARWAMCAPLWSGERVVGALVLDGPETGEAGAEGVSRGPGEGGFGARDLELATALANFAAVAIERIRFAERAAHERRLRARLERYHSPAVVEDVLGRGELDAADGGGERPRLARAEVSVLFADLSGFTGFAEASEPEEVAELLAAYFDLAVDAVFAAGGTLDKFLGDAVMAFFGAPVVQPDHAARAVRAALALRRSAAGWAREREAASRPVFPLHVAVHSGPVVAGEVGSERRVNFTVLGNTVNVAARLEAVTPAGEIYVTADTLSLARRDLGDELAAEPVGPLALAGLSRPVETWRLVEPEAG